MVLKDPDNRRQALELAVYSTPALEAAGDTVERAQKFYDFLTFVGVDDDQA